MTQQKLLKDCPFCGNVAMIYEIPAHKHVIATFMPEHKGSWAIECTCGSGFISDTKDEVIQKWNSRIHGWTPFSYDNEPPQNKKILGIDEKGVMHVGVFMDCKMRYDFVVGELGAKGTYILSMEQITHWHPIPELNTKKS